MGIFDFLKGKEESQDQQLEASNPENTKTAKEVGEKDPDVQKIIDNLTKPQTAEQEGQEPEKEPQKER